MAKMTGGKPRSVLSSEYHHCVYAAFCIHFMCIVYIVWVLPLDVHANNSYLGKNSGWLGGQLTIILAISSCTISSV